VGIVGDILHSRVARSDVAALTKMGSQVTLVAPPTLIPPAIDSWGAEISYDLEEVLPKLDVVYLLRVQKERQNEQLVPSLREYATFWGLDRRRVDLMKPEAIIMHPGPMNRGVEIAADVADLERSIIIDQVTNGVAVRMSLLYLMLGAADRALEEVPVG
jgi:aspartate carbamoyltransferase catalytic subunit